MNVAGRPVVTSSERSEKDSRSRKQRVTSGNRSIMRHLQSQRERNPEPPQSEKLTRKEPPRDNSKATLQARCNSGAALSVSTLTPEEEERGALSQFSRALCAALNESDDLGKTHKDVRTFQRARMGVLWRRDGTATASKNTPAEQSNR